jgi:hypothetical protein
MIKKIYGSNSFFTTFAPVIKNFNRHKRFYSMQLFFSFNSSPIQVNAWNVVVCTKRERILAEYTTLVIYENVSFFGNSANRKVDNNMCYFNCLT